MPAAFQIRMRIQAKFALKVVTKEKLGGGGGKVANARYWARIVVIDVLLYLNLAAILENVPFLIRWLQPIEYATFDRKGKVQLTVCFSL